MSFRFARSSRTAFARASFRSMKASSSSVRPRNSFVDPSLQPAFSKRCRFRAFVASSFRAPRDHTPPARRRQRSITSRGVFLVFLANTSLITIASGSILHDPPLVTLVCDSKLVAASADGWHGPGVRQAQPLPALQSPQQGSRFDPALLRERRRLDLAMEPGERFPRPVRHLRDIICQT